MAMYACHSAKFEWLVGDAVNWILFHPKYEGVFVPYISDWFYRSLYVLFFIQIIILKYKRKFSNNVWSYNKRTQQAW